MADLNDNLQTRLPLENRSRFNILRVQDAPFSDYPDPFYEENNEKFARHIGDVTDAYPEYVSRIDDLNGIHIVTGHILPEMSKSYISLERLEMMAHEKGIANPTMNDLQTLLNDNNLTVADRKKGVYDPDVREVLLPRTATGVGKNEQVEFTAGHEVGHSLSDLAAHEAGDNRFSHGPSDPLRISNQNWFVGAYLKSVGASSLEEVAEREKRNPFLRGDNREETLANILGALWDKSPEGAERRNATLNSPQNAELIKVVRQMNDDLIKISNENPDKASFATSVTAYFQDKQKKFTAETGESKRPVQVPFQP